jgi:hypothetical protein
MIQRARKNQVSVVVGAVLVFGGSTARAANVAIFSETAPDATSGSFASPSDVVEATKRVGHTPVADEIARRARASISLDFASRAGLCAAGAAAGAEFAVAYSSTASAAGVRLELRVCRRATGEGELLARTLSGRNQVDQIAEMLQLLFRAGGVGPNEVMWKVLPATDVSSTTVPAPPPSPPPLLPPTDSPSRPTPPSSASVTLPAPDSPTEHEDTYGARSVSLSLAQGFGGAVLRPSGARGSTFAGETQIHAGYTFGGVPLELRARLILSYIAPSVFRGDVGARYAVKLAPSLWVGPELGVGAWAPFGSGDGKVRAMVDGGAFAAYRVVPWFQIEATAELAFALGGTGALGFLLGSLRGQVRF